MLIKQFKIIDPKNTNWVEYKCDICNKKKITTLGNFKKSKYKPLTICRVCSTRKTGKAHKGNMSPTKGIKRIHKTREKASNWNGGKYINSAGYVMILVKSGSINRKSGWENYRPEHIIAIEQSIKRKIRKNECIHHIDGNRQNNSLENLVLIRSNQHHRKTHMSLQKVGYELYKMGKIRFDKRVGEYKLNF